MPGERVNARWALATPRPGAAPGAGALALVQLMGDVDGALALLRIEPVAVGAVAVRDLAGVDRGVVARWSRGFAQLIPHGGVAVTRALAERLEGAGIARDDRPDPLEAYPEAAGEVEALMLDALARAASPLAIDLLLAQPARWEGRDPARARTAEEARRDAALRRLIDPPLIAVVGAANIGKSTLTNVLAGRAVSIVTDEPGTTRDHVGVTLDLAGVVVRWMDAPGIREGAGGVEREAIAAALAMARQADLLVLAGDASRPPLCVAALGIPAGIAGAPEVVRVGLRADVGRPTWPADAILSARTGEGVEGFVSLVRERLVPRGMLEDPGPWRFWE